MVSNQGRQEGGIDPADGPVAEFAIALRKLREQSGRPTYRQLATLSAKVGTPYSDTTLSTAARGHTPPSHAVVTAYLQACLAHAKTDAQKAARTVEEWDARWNALDAELTPTRPPQPSTTAPAPDSPSTAEPDTPAVDRESDHPERPTPGARPFIRRRRLALMVPAVIAGIGGLGIGARYGASSGSVAAGASAPDGLPLGVSSPAIDLGGDSRCGRVRYVNGPAWSPCTRVEGTKLVFAVRLSNAGEEPVTVNAKLAYVRAGVEHSCPGSWGTGMQIEVRSGETVTSPLTVCTAPKVPATDFQAKAWVVNLNGPWEYREMSQTVHIQTDGVKAIWADGA